MRVLVLFTRDLRVHDHPALREACEIATEVVPLFVLDPALTMRSPNRSRFLSECLADLDRALAHRGGRLFVREGDVAVEAAAVATQSSCDAIFLTRDASSYAARRTADLTALGAAGGFRIKTFPGHSVVDPGMVAPHGANAYRVFSPYLRAWTDSEHGDVVSVPRTVRVPRDIEAGRLPGPDRWQATALDLAPGGETEGRRRMQRFLRDAPTYAEGRNDLVGDVTSRLSPYLHFGCVSVRELASRACAINGAEAFVRQLAWRDFFLQLLAARPSMPWQDLRPGSPEPKPVDDRIFEAWTLGRTGIPLVDAGMRQLLREGWMHNRARLVTASFLTRRAGVRWQEGAGFFDRHLVDGDLANNAGNWQWVAGTGASPRRGPALNPVRQAERFDPQGQYVRSYVPELAGAGSAAVLRPWRHPDLLRATGYPAPILEIPN